MVMFVSDKEGDNAPLSNRKVRLPAEHGKKEGEEKPKRAGGLLPLIKRPLELLRKKRAPENEEKRAQEPAASAPKPPAQSVPRPPRAERSTPAEPVAPPLQPAVSQPPASRHEAAQRAETHTVEAGEGAMQRPRRRRGRRSRGSAISSTAPAPTLSQVIKRSWHPRDNPIEPMEGKVRFGDLNIPVDLLHAVSDMGWAYCTPVQAAILPAALDGKDCTGKAQTGTGKTAAFLISIMTRLLAKPPKPGEKKIVPRALILAPTRELVQQIEKDALALSAYTSIKTLAIYGGSSYDRQRDILARAEPEIIMATPGRLMDLMQQGSVHLTHTDTLVIDEADRMLDMGFIPDVRSIVRHMPPRSDRHTMMFSATLTPDVLRLASQWLNNPITVEIEPDHVVVDTVNQRVLVVENRQKLALLYNIIQRENPEQIILFANRRETVRELFALLQGMKLSCGMISGELPQNQRERTLEDFKSKRIRILIATDVAGRGLHIEGVSHVINYNLPTDPEDYVHRIGRTGRAGAFGTSISFACEDDSFYLTDIEQYVGRSLPCEHPEDGWLTLPPELEQTIASLRASAGRRRRDERRGGGGGRPGGRSQGGGRRGPPRGRR